MEEAQDDNINYEMDEQDMDSNAMNQNILLQSKDNLIKQLQRKIEAFEKMRKNKIKNYPTMIIY